MGIFNEIKPQKLQGNIFDMIGRQWMLITAGIPGDFNTMTASWGGAGILWGKTVAISFIRPQRYTYQFMEKYNHYTLSFFGEEYREALNICGSRSGRDTDKVKETGLTPVDIGDAVYFDEASVVFICRKLYAQDLTLDNFIDKEIARTYSVTDLHRTYIGEIERVLIKE